jgi:Methyltransferase FkbM domain
MRMPLGRTIIGGRGGSGRTVNIRVATALVVIVACLFHTMVLFSLDGAARTDINEDAVPSRPQDVGALGTSSIKGTSSERQKRMERYHAVYKYAPPVAVPSGTSEDKNTKKTNCGTPPDFESYFALPPRYRSRNSEDKTMYLLFRKLYQELGSKGTFIELGAFDGVLESNSRFFQECLNWTGLLIEGNPSKYDELVKNRPNAHRMSFAPSCSVRMEAKNVTIEFVANENTMAGLSGRVRSSGGSVVNVPCGSLGPVIQDIFQGGHVHFFSLDVEGAEPLVLKNVDFSTVFIESIMVESWSRNCPKEPKECQTRSEAREIMKKAGYHLFNTVVEKSDLFIHPNSPLMNISATPVW